MTSEYLGLAIQQTMLNSDHLSLRVLLILCIQLIVFTAFNSAGKQKCKEQRKETKGKVV